jgi:hypothetical protein
MTPMAVYGTFWLAGVVLAQLSGQSALAASKVSDVPNATLTKPIVTTPGFSTASPLPLKNRNPQVVRLLKFGGVFG